MAFAQEREQLCHQCLKVDLLFPKFPLNFITFVVASSKETESDVACECEVVGGESYGLCKCSILLITLVELTASMWFFL